MTKENLQKFIDDCKSAGIERWALRFEGGNRTAVHGNDGCRICLRDNDVVIIEPCRNYASNGFYNITICAYDMIDNVKAIDLPITETIGLLTNLGLYDSTMEEFIKNGIHRQPIIPGTAGLSTIKDADGKDIIPPGSSGYVTR